MPDLQPLFTRVGRRAAIELRALSHMRRAGVIGGAPPKQTIEGLKLSAQYGQIPSAVMIAALRSRDKPGLIDELGTLTFAELDARSSALACALRARGLKRARHGRDPVPQPSRPARHQLRRGQARRAAAAAEHRLRRSAAAGRVRARGRRAARTRRGVRGAGGADRTEARSRARLERRQRRRPRHARAADRQPRRPDPAAAIRARGAGAADERHDRDAEGRAALGRAARSRRSGRCCRRCPTARTSRRTSPRRCSTGSATRRWRCR